MTKDQIQNLGERICRSVKFDKNGCWLWQLSKDKDGYGRMAGVTSRNLISVHKASWLVFKGDVPRGKQVLHRCDVRNCCNPFHLYLGDSEQNMLDRELRVRHPKHVSESTVRAIHNDYHRGLSDYDALAEKYDVCDETVKRIVHKSRPRYKRILEAEAGAKE